MPDLAERPFAERVRLLPTLGLGISTEFGACRSGLDVNAFAAMRPDLVHFLEIGADLERGIDLDARRWIDAGRPTTYHFLDVNLEEPEDLDVDWVDDTRTLAGQVRAAWLCGDAGLWHVGPRDRGHGTLMPPILERDSAMELAGAVRILRERSGFEVLPENPPAHVYLGKMHLLEYFSAVAEEADCGLLLDVAHLAIYQHAAGREPLDGLRDFAVERVVEMHVAGGSYFEHDGRTFIEDDHGPAVLEATWRIFEALLPRAVNLRAIVIECERNPMELVVPLFESVKLRWSGVPR